MSVHLAAFPLAPLVERIRSGDASAKPEIVVAMMPMLWGICTQVGTAYGENPGNLLSAGAMAVEKSIPYLTKGSIGSWVFFLKKIVMSAAIHEAKCNLPGRSLSGPATKIGYCESLDAEVTHHDEACGTLHDILADQSPEVRSYDYVYRSLAKLKRNQREIVELHFGFDGSGGRTQEESATLLGYTRQNVSLHISKAMRKLRALLAEELAMLDTRREMSPQEPRSESKARASSRNASMLSSRTNSSMTERSRSAPRSTWNARFQSAAPSESGWRTMPEGPTVQLKTWISRTSGRIAPSPSSASGSGI